MPISKCNLHSWKSNSPDSSSKSDKKGDKGDKPIATDHVELAVRELAVRELVISELEAAGWSATAKKIYGGKLHWYIRKD